MGRDGPADGSTPSLSSAPGPLARVWKWAKRKAGGRARLAVLALLAAVVGLDGADKATISVNARAIEHAFSINDAGIGLLVSVSSLTGALFTLPVGVLTDRVTRVRLLGTSIALWALASLASGLAPSFGWLMAARVALGAVTATAGPTVASLFGDFFPAGERARLYGYVLAGELVGTGAGYVITSGITALTSWRFSLAWLTLPALALSAVVWRTPEPSRGRQETLTSGRERSKDRGKPSSQGPAGEALPEAQDAAGHLAEESGVPVVRGQVLVEDPRRMSLWRVARYVLRIRTALLMITASALGYFFFAGVRTFALLFATRHYAISTGAASGLTLVVGTGALAGVFGGGRLADLLLRRGYLNGRVLVPSLALLLAPLALAPAFITTSLWAAVPLLTLGAALLAAPNPPLDAARLDIVPPGLWGRAEAIRTAVRTLGEFLAPLLFGYLSASVFTGADHLRDAFLLGLAPLAAAASLGFLALWTYPRDVATANASGPRRASA